MTKPSFVIAAVLYIHSVFGVLSRFSEETCASEELDSDSKCLRAGSSRALLQVHSKAVSFANEVSEHRSSTAGIGKTAPLDEKGYKAVQAACCFEEVLDFAMRLIASPSLDFEVCEPGWLSGVSLFFDCPDDGNSYSGLVDALRDGTKGPCAGLAPPGQCKPLSPDCPEFPTATPPPCGSKEAATTPTVTDAPPPAPDVTDTPQPDVTDAPPPVVTDAPPPVVTDAPPTAAPAKAAPAVTPLPPAFASTAIGCFHFSYFAMKCKSSCPDGNDYVDASWPDCAVGDQNQCQGLFVDGASMNYNGPNQCQAQCQGFSFTTNGEQTQVQPEGSLLTPSDVGMILMPMGNERKKRCNGDPWMWKGQTWGNLGTFGSSAECSSACLVEWACIIALYRVDNGQCSMMKGGVCHIRDTSSAFGGNDEEYDVWEKVCAR